MTLSDAGGAACSAGHMCQQVVGVPVAEQECVRVRQWVSAVGASGSGSDGTGQHTPSASVLPPM